MVGLFPEGLPKKGSRLIKEAALRGQQRLERKMMLFLQQHSAVQGVDPSSDPGSEDKGTK